MQERNTRRAIRIVFDMGDLGRNAGFVAPEIDNAIFLLMPPPAVTNGYFTTVVSTAALAEFYDQGFFRSTPCHFFERRSRLKTSPGRCWIIGLYRHLGTLEYVDLF